MCSSDLWENNPHLTPLADGAGEVIECHYPLIHRSNTGPWHFIHGYTQFLGERLGVASGKWLWFSCRHPLGFAP